MNLVAELLVLMDSAFASWTPHGDAAVAARDRCRMAWSKATLAARRGLFTEARTQLETALRIGEAEGGGWEEREALRLLEPDRAVREVAA